MVQMRPSTTFFKDGVKRLKKNPVAMVSFFIIIIITLSSIILPFVWPYGYDAQLGATLVFLREHHADNLDKIKNFFMDNRASMQKQMVSYVRANVDSMYID